MSPLRPAATLVAVALVMVTVLAACGSSGASASPAAASPGASGSTSGACATAPGSITDSGTWTGTAQAIVPVVISNQIACGKTRIMFSLLDAQNRPVAAPDRPVTVGFYDLGRDASKPVATAPATFIWAIENERGVYAVDADLPEAGVWGLEFTSPDSAPSPVLRVTTDVLESSSVVKVGDPAPSIKSPTLADVGGDVSKISTDTEPDKAFYETSIADALAGHKPFILVFATPKFCVSQQCGPTLDKLKPIAAANPDVTFINVEPYKLQDVDGQLQPVLDANGQLQATDVTTQYGLYTEPWIFAVDGDGIVRDSFELIASDQEIQDAITEITKPS